MPARVDRLRHSHTAAPRSLSRSGKAWSRVSTKASLWIPFRGRFAFAATFLAVLLALVGCGGEPVATTIHLASGSITAPSGQTYQVGQAASILISGLGFTPAASDTTVVLTPLSGGSPISISVQSVTAQSNGSLLVTFTIPAISITAPTQYNVTLSGKTGTTSFDASGLTVTIQPGPAVLSLSPATAAGGATLDVTITGISTTWVTGTTANFGAGVSVGGAAAGASGPVQAVNATQLTAHLVIDPTATGKRDVSVTSGTQTLTLAGGFTVTAAPKAPVPSAGGPYTGTTGQPITFSAAASSDPGGLALTYIWNFGDGSAGNGVAPVHSYGTAGKYTATVTTTNSGGISASATATVTVVDPPKAPVAGAGGPYSGVAGTAVSFNGGASTDPKGETLTYAWNFGDGATGTGVTTTHTYASAGTYTVSLTVTNTDNLSNTATTPAVVAAAPLPPVANAGGPYNGLTGTAISFTGAASTDPKNEALTYAWNFGDSTSGTGVTTTHTYATAGTYTVTLTVTNTDSKSASASTTTTVSTPQPPTSNAGGPYTGTINVPLQFSGGASTDPKSESLTFAWTFGDGGTGTGAAPVHTYAATGTFTVTLKVTNTDNLSNTSTSSVTIGTAPQVPVSNAGGPYTGTTGVAVSFSGASSSDPKGETLTYAWNFGDGGTGAGASVTHTYAAAGTFTVTLKVTNTDNLSATATSTAVINTPPQPPVAKVGGPYSGTAGTAVVFSGQTSTDPKNETLTYAWTFGDGSTGSGATASHVYANPGTFVVMLKVTNTDNLSNSATTSAVIVGVPPVSKVGGPYTGTTGVAVSFNGSASIDPRGETLTYAWNFGDSTTGTGVSPTHTYTNAGTYNVSLTVTNTDNLSTTSSTVATIAPAPPVAKAGGPYNGTAGTAISFDGSASTDPKNETLTYLWTFGDGQSATGATPTHTYLSAGTFAVTLKVTDTDNLSNTATTSATIVAAPPVANAGGPYTGIAGTSVSFNGTGSTDPVGETLTYNWNFGDGGTATVASPTHTYTAKGTYSVTLTVTNTDHLSNTVTTSATISAAAPVANAGGPYTGTAGTSVSFSGGSSTDPANETLSYSWNFGDSATGTGKTPTHTYATKGTYTVTLTVTNTDNLTNTATTSATIAAAPPVANAGGPYTGTAGTSVSFNGGSSTDPAGETFTYAWNFGDSSTATGKTPTHTYATKGTYTVTLTVTNTDNLTNTATTSATIAAAAPVANAGGPYTGTAGTAVSFNGGSSTDPAGETLTYAWNFGDSSTGTGKTPTHTYAAKGTYTVTLIVTNTDNLSNTATTSATIAAAAPVANAGGPYTGTSGTAVNFNGGSSTDHAGETLTYAWNFGDSSTGTGKTPTHTYASGGTYTVTLTVTNTDNLSNTATTSATITNAQQPPVANAGGPYTGTAGTAVNFNGGNSTDPKNETLSYAWNFGDSSTGTGKTPTHTYANAGTYTVTLTVTNTDNLTNTASTTATISTPAAQPPTAKAGGPYTGTAGTAVSFNGSASTDPKNETLSYAWNFGDSTTGTGATPTHIYASSGTYTVTLTVTNTDSATNTATTTATIAAAPQAPVANAGGPYTGTAGAVVSFNGAGSTDPKSETLSYAWNFGDSTTGTGATPTHTYANAGTYTVTLTVTNTDNLTNTATTSATISASAQPPVARVGGPYTGTTGNAVSFNGSASTDPKSETLSYSWNFGDSTTGTGATPTHAYANTGTYTVSLTVTNTDSLSGSSSTTATITAATTQTPVANPGGPYTGNSGIGISFNGAASNDPANPTAGPFALTFSWNFGDGGTGSGAKPTHTYASGGTYNVSLTVQSASGQTATASTTATVTTQASLGAPTPVPGGPYSGTTAAAVNFSGTGSTDPNNATLTYHWSFGDGSSADGATVSHTYGGAGTFSVQLTVFNGSVSNSAGTSATITAPATPSLVVNAGGPYTVAVNQPLTLDGTGTNNPNSRQQTFVWDFGDGSNGTGSQATHVYTASGTYTVTLTASDPTGLGGNATAQVTVTGPAAEAITTSAGGPYTDVTSHAITFDASASSDNLSNPLTYAWDYGDGNTDTGVNPTHAYTTRGTYTVKVTASSGTASATATSRVIITTALQVNITSPVANALFGTTTTTVTGTLTSPNLSVSVNGIPASVSGTNFTATGVSLREGVNLISATATDSTGGVGTGSVSVVMDATAPTASITSPADGASVTTSTIAVAGLVNDSVTGTVGSNDVTVTVNGLAAQVANRSFLLPSLLLVPGANTLTVVVTDKVGNTSKTTRTVQYIPPSRQLTLNAFSGNGQSGAVHALLAQPLVVQLLSADGTPVVGRPVTFTVSRSDGMVEILPNIAQSLYVNTDINGKASVLFQLGSRSGLGINQVTASTPGAPGTVLFTETSTTGTPAQIHAIHGENQRGLLGEPLAEAFQVLVQDAYGNPLPGVTVTYTTTGGDGALDNATPATDANGRAQASLTLGQQEGVGNYNVTADFAGDTGQPATFAASGYAAGPVANTRVSGVVLDNANTPIPNATVRILGTTLSTTSDTNGHFMVNGAPVGTVTLSVDGSTSTRTETFPFLSFVLQDLPGQNNTLNKPVYLPTIDADTAQTVGGDDPVTLTMAGVPGVAFTVAPHSVTFPDGSTVGKLSLSQVKSDMVPMEPSNGSGPDLIWTLQPAGTRFSVPVQVTVPNTQGFAPGTVSEIYQYDHDLEQFVSAGTAHVSADGSVIISDPGFGLTKAGWGHGFNFPLPTDCPETCDDHNECTNDIVLICGCKHTLRPNAACGSNKPSSCQLPGICIGKTCSGIRRQDGDPCDDGLFCTEHDVCDANGVCKGTPKPNKPGHGGLSPDTIKFEGVLENNLLPFANFFGKYGLFIKIEPVFNPEYNEERQCCEAIQQDDTLVTHAKVNVGLKISTDQIPIPGAVYSVPFVGGIAAYIQLGVTLTGNAAKDVDYCQNQSCWSGGLNLEGTIEIGVKTFAPGIGISGGGNAGLSANLKVGCHALISKIGTTDVKAVFTFVLGSGKAVQFEKIIIPSQTIVEATVPWDY